MEKTVAEPTLPKTRKRFSGWTLLFVGENGKVVRFPYFKGLIFTWVISFFIFLVAAIFLSILYQEKTKENRALEDALQASRQRVKSLRHEKDILMAHVVVSETKSKRVPQKKEIPLKKVEKSPEPLPKEEDTNEPEVVAAVASDASEETEPEPPTDTPELPDRPGPRSSVSVDDFFALLEPGSNTLRIKYKIRNINPESTPVAGRTFLVLKSKEVDSTNWLILPSVPMESGKPSKIKKGRSFSITRFKTIRFKAPYRAGPKPFSTATILVYTSTGELLLEKSFPLERDDRESTLKG